MVAFVQDGDVPSQLRDADSAKEAQLLETWKAYKKGFQEGISIFNKKPKKGISFLQVDSSLMRLLRAMSASSEQFTVNRTPLTRIHVGNCFGAVM